jgi:hypothetical protein
VVSRAEVEFLRADREHGPATNRIRQTKSNLMTPLAHSIASAIQQQEGFGTPQAITINANNNPGALRSWPGMPSRNGFAVFPDYATGYNALVTDVQTNIDRGLSLSQFISKYAPSADSNDPNSYTAFVASRVGIDPNAPMNAVGIAPDSGTLDPSTVLADLGIPSGSSEAGVVDWGMVGLVGVGLFVAWLVFFKD